MGQYHTIEIFVDFPFTLYKTNWDKMYLESLDDACNISVKTDLAAIVMQEGLAHICLITSYLTSIRAKVEKRIPKKRQVGIIIWIRNVEE